MMIKFNLREHLADYFEMISAAIISMVITAQTIHF